MWLLKLKLAFAGWLPFIWHWGLGVGLIIILVGLAIFTESVPLIGRWLKDLRHQLLWAAFGIALLLAGQYIGIHDEARRCVAKTVVIEKFVDKAVSKAKSPTGHAQGDPWDSPEN